MLMETDVVGLPVLVLGPIAAAASAVRRFRRAGAQVIAVGSAPALMPGHVQWARLAVLVGAARGWQQARAALTGSVPLVEEDAPILPRHSGARRRRPRRPGPGDPRRAARARGADVVLTDRLAEGGRRRGARAGRGDHRCRQAPRPPRGAADGDRARHGRAGPSWPHRGPAQGRRPLRLRPGLEEVAAAVTAGCPYRRARGAVRLGVPGAVGVPVTHRNVSHVSPSCPAICRSSEGRGQGPGRSRRDRRLLMGVHNLVPLTAAALERCGLDPDTRAPSWSAASPRTCAASWHRRGSGRRSRDGRGSRTCRHRHRRGRAPVGRLGGPTRAR